MSSARLLLLYARLARAQWLPPARLQARRDAGVRRLVAHAAATVPFYRERFQALGLRPADIGGVADLGLLPVTTKAELQAAGETARLSTAFRREALETARTSGSSGRPFTIFRDPHFARLRRAAFLRALMAGPYRPGMRVLVVSGVPRDRRSDWLGWTYVSSETPPAELLRLLRERRPAILYGFLTPLRQLAELARSDGRPLPRLAAVYTTAETLDARTRRLLETVLAAPVFDIYGSTEAGPLAFECTAHDGYHLADDLAITELLPGPAGGPARVVTTPLELTAMPLLRYEVGDLAVPGPAAPCACGRGLGRVGRFEGRLVDCVRLEDGGLLSPYHLTLALEAIPGLDRYRVVQDGIGSFRVLAQGPGGTAAATAERIRAAVRGQVGDQAAVAVEWAASLDPPPGRKFRVVECRLPEPAMAACAS